MSYVCPGGFQERHLVFVEMNAVGETGLPGEESKVVEVLDILHLAAVADGLNLMLVLGGVRMEEDPVDVRGNLERLLHQRVGAGENESRSEERRVGKECRSRW